MSRRDSVDSVASCNRVCAGLAAWLSLLLGRVASKDAPISKASAPKATLTVVSKNLSPRPQVV